MVVLDNAVGDGVEICKTGYATTYYKNGKLHRENDLPAIECANGTKLWYVNGERHRDNGLPAVEYSCGDKSWYVNGKRHRDNGLPAIERSHGHVSWWVNGTQIFSWEEYQCETNCSKEELVMYKLIYGDIK